MLDQSAPSCPFCSTSLRDVFNVRVHSVRECVECDYRRCDSNQISEQHLAEHYDDKYFFGGGAGYQDYLSEQQLLTQHGRRYGELLNKYTSAGDLLDVGAAAGFLMQGLNEAGWKSHGIEPNLAMCEFARQEFGHSMHCACLEKCDTERQFDAITMIQVVAHFHDLNRALEAAAKQTKPGGHWLIESWNFRSLSARVFGKHWHEYSPPTVLHWFSPSGLERVAALFGMELIAQGRPKKYINGEHAKSLLRYRLATSRLGRIALPAMNCLPDKLRIRYPAEDLFWMLLQKRG